MSDKRHIESMGIGIFVAVLVSLQVLLLSVGLEALLTFEPAQALTAAILSTVLASGSIILYFVFRRR